MFFTWNCYTSSLIGFILLMYSARFWWYNFVSDKGPINLLGFLARYRSQYTVSCHVEMCTSIVIPTNMYVILCAICPRFDVPVFDNRISLSWVELKHAAYLAVWICMLSYTMYACMCDGMPRSYELRSPFVLTMGSTEYTLSIQSRFRNTLCKRSMIRTEYFWDTKFIYSLLFKPASNDFGCICEEIWKDQCSMEVYITINWTKWCCSKLLIKLVIATKTFFTFVMLLKWAAVIGYM